LILLNPHSSTTKILAVDTARITVTFATILVPRFVPAFTVTIALILGVSGLNESRDFRGSAVPDDRPESSATLKDLQKLIQSLQSKLDKHVCQAHPAPASPRRERVAYMAHNSDTDELAYSAFFTDNHDGRPPSYTVYPCLLGVQTTIDSPPPQWRNLLVSCAPDLLGLGGGGYFFYSKTLQSPVGCYEIFDQIATLCWNLTVSPD
jgi:hypothetical protein